MRYLAAVELQCFGQVDVGERLPSGQVGEGPGDPQDEVASAGGERADVVLGVEGGGQLPGCVQDAGAQRGGADVMVGRMGVTGPPAGCGGSCEADPARAQSCLPAESRGTVSAQTCASRRWIAATV